MTRYEQGFMNKCAEYGLDVETSVELMKVALSKGFAPRRGGGFRDKPIGVGEAAGRHVASNAVADTLQRKGMSRGKARVVSGLANAVTGGLRVPTRMS